MTAPNITPEILQAQPHHDYGSAEANAREYRLLDEDEIDWNAPLLEGVDQWDGEVWRQKQAGMWPEWKYRTKWTPAELRAARGLPPEAVADTKPYESAPLRAALLAQHEWHLQQTDRTPLYFGDTIGQINADEYQESELCQKTMDALYSNQEGGDTPCLPQPKLTTPAVSNATGEGVSPSAPVASEIPTPRTDTLERETSLDDRSIRAGKIWAHARTLERELTSITAERDKWHQMWENRTQQHKKLDRHATDLEQEKATALAQRDTAQSERASAVVERNKADEIIEQLHAEVARLRDEKTASFVQYGMETGELKSRVASITAELERAMQAVRFNANAVIEADEKERKALAEAALLRELLDAVRARLEGEIIENLNSSTEVAKLTQERDDARAGLRPDEWIEKCEKIEKQFLAMDSHNAEEP